MLHARLTSGNPVGFKQPHLRPANAKPIADRVVDFFSRCNPVLDQPQRLAPDSFQKTIGNMRIDFLAQMQRVHANPRDNFLGTINNTCRVGLGCDQFDQRQQVDGVERMRHHDLTGIIAPSLQLGRLETRR